MKSKELLIKIAEDTTVFTYYTGIVFKVLIKIASNDGLIIVTNAQIKEITKLGKATIYNAIKNLMVRNLLIKLPMPHQYRFDINKLNELIEIEDNKKAI